MDAGLDGIPLPEVDERLMRAVGMGQYARDRAIVHFFIDSFAYLFETPVRDLEVAPECCGEAVRLALTVD